MKKIRQTETGHEEVIETELSMDALYDENFRLRKMIFALRQEIREYRHGLEEAKKSLLAAKSEMGL